MKHIGVTIHRLLFTLLGWLGGPWRPWSDAPSHAEISSMAAILDKLNRRAQETTHIPTHDLVYWPDGPWSSTSLGANDSGVHHCTAHFVYIISALKFHTYTEDSSNRT